MKTTLNIDIFLKQIYSFWARVVGQRVGICLAHYQLRLYPLARGTLAPKHC